MREQIPEGTSFPTAQCSKCAKTVLTWVALDADGVEVRYCVHCNSEVQLDLKWLTAAEVEANGYYFGASPEVKRGGGCGTGCCSRRSGKSTESGV